jgi:hypothetical protein
VAQYIDTRILTVRLQIRVNTWRRHSDFVRMHLVPALGRIALAKLTPQQVQLFYARKLGEGLSYSTVLHIHGVLHGAGSSAARYVLAPTTACAKGSSSGCRGKIWIASATACRCG